MTVLTYDYRMLGGQRRHVTELCLVVNSHGGSSTTYSFVKSLNPFASITEVRDWHGLHAYAVPYFPSPVIEYLSYFWPTFRIPRERLTGDICISLAGSNQTSVPFAIRRQPYYCWIASPLRKEWAARRNIRDLSAQGIRSSVDKIVLAPISYWLEKVLCKRAVRVFTVSKYGKHALIESHGLPDDHVRVLYPSIDTEQFTPRADWTQRGSPPYLFTAARISDRRKNLPLMIEAFAAILRYAPSSVPGNLQLVIAGSVPSDGEHLRLVRRHGVEGRVSFLGRITDDHLASMYRDAEMLVLTSREEGLGLTIMEALSSGLPVVSTRSGGPEELFEDGSTGVLAEHTPASVAAAAIGILTDNARRAAMGRAARQQAVRLFSREAFWARFSRLLAED